MHDKIFNCTSEILAQTFYTYFFFCFVDRRPQRQRFRTNPDAIVWMGGLSRRLRVSELKTELRGLNVNPVRLVWRGARGFAFLHFQTTDNAKEAVDVLYGREFDGREAKVSHDARTASN